MPQPGQGNPVSILNGQSDCECSICASTLPIKKGIANTNMAKAIPNMLLNC